MKAAEAWAPDGFARAPAWPAPSASQREQWLPPDDPAPDAAGGADDASAAAGFSQPGPQPWPKRLKITLPPPPPPPAAAAPRAGPSKRGRKPGSAAVAATRGKGKGPAKAATRGGLHPRRLSRSTNKRVLPDEAIARAVRAAAVDCMHGVC